MQGKGCVPAPCWLVVASRESFGSWVLALQTCSLGAKTLAPKLLQFRSLWNSDMEKEIIGYWENRLIMRANSTRLYFVKKTAGLYCVSVTWGNYFHFVNGPEYSGGLGILQFLHDLQYPRQNGKTFPSTRENEIPVRIYLPQISQFR